MRPPPGGRERTRGLSAPNPGAYYWGLPGPKHRALSTGAARPRALRLPPAGPLLDAQKWAEKPLGRPQTPFVCPIGRLQTLPVRSH